jgi:crossover junction endodeoxyribonuclease RuvC
MWYNQNEGKQAMPTLGIDPGTATTGFGLVKEEKGLRLIDFGCIRTSKAETPSKRLSQLYVELKKIIKKYQPHVVAVEKLFFNKNSKTAMAVGQARGMALLAAAEMGIPVTEYSPMEVKVAVTGYGLAEKQQVQKMVQNIFKLKEAPKPDDAADALAVAICHLHSHKLKEL